MQLLGGIWVKGGQLLSTRLDIISDKLALEMSTLRENYVFGEKKSSEYFISYLGESFYKKVSYITQVNSGSVADVYKVDHTDLGLLAIKIVRSSAKKQFKADAIILTLFSKFLELIPSKTTKMIASAIVCLLYTSDAADE